MKRDQNFPMILSKGSIPVIRDETFSRRVLDQRGTVYPCDQG